MSACQSEVGPVRKPWPAGIGNDQEWLLDFSPRLRAVLAMRERPRNRPLAFSLKGVEAFERLCNDIRLELRVQIDRPGEVLRTEPEVLQFLRYPAFCQSQDYRELQRRVSRKGADTRVLLTVDRAIRDAAHLGIPLWPSVLCVDHGERVRAFVSNEVDTRPSEWLHGTGLSVQFGHATLRHLPWAAWEWIERLVERASRATGYWLQGVYPRPGEFELAGDCRPLEATDEPRARSRRPNPEEARAESDALLRFYRGGPWGSPFDPVEPDHD